MIKWPHVIKLIFIKKSLYCLILLVYSLADVKPCSLKKKDVHINSVSNGEKGNGLLFQLHASSMKDYE